MKKAYSIKFIGGIALIAISAMLTGCSKKQNTKTASGGTEQKVVRINFSTGSLCHAPVHIAMALGLFEEELGKIGQKAEYVQVVEGGATLGEMIASGKVDAGYGLYATQLQAIENGLPHLESIPVVQNTMFAQTVIFIQQQIYAERQSEFPDLQTVL